MSTWDFDCNCEAVTHTEETSTTHSHFTRHRTPGIRMSQRTIVLRILWRMLNF